MRDSNMLGGLRRSLSLPSGADKSRSGCSPPKPRAPAMVARRPPPRPAARGSLDAGSCGVQPPPTTFRSNSGKLGASETELHEDDAEALLAIWSEHCVLLTTAGQSVRFCGPVNMSQAMSSFTGPAGLGEQKDPVHIDIDVGGCRAGRRP